MIRGGKEEKEEVWFTLHFLGLFLRRGLKFPRRPSCGSVLRRRWWRRLSGRRSGTAAPPLPHWYQEETAPLVEAVSAVCQTRPRCPGGEWRTCKCHLGPFCSAAESWTETSCSCQSPDLAGPAKCFRLDVLSSFPPPATEYSVCQRRPKLFGRYDVKKRILTMMKMFLLHNWWCGDENLFSE